MPVRIKICGITRFEDARVAASLGADALGFNFYPKSPRYIKPSAAREIIRQLPPLIARVGIFVDETMESVVAMAHEAGIDTVQLHGRETPAQCASLPFPVIKVFSVDPEWNPSALESYPVSAFLLDTWDDKQRGGTGKTFDWSIAERASRKYGNVILAGGLGPTNIREAIEAVVPYAVDVNSGVEVSPGIKNPRKMRDAINFAKGWK